jgi:hypothetical protein
MNVVFFNLPSALFRIMFPPVTENIVSIVNRERMIQHLALFREVSTVVVELRRSIFVRCDIFTISGLLSLISGLLLVLRRFALYQVLHVVICLSLVLLIAAVRAIAGTEC